MVKKNKFLVKQIADRYVQNYDFKMYNESNIFNDFTNYFSGIDEFLIENFNKQKGIMLIGNIGSGKTTIMKIFSEFALSTKTNNYRIASVREIERAFSKKGEEGLDMFVNNESTNNYGVTNSNRYALCIDDVGIEQAETTRYGNTTNIISELMLDRYELFINNMIKTHATTNLTPDLLRERYNDRVYDRMKEMFNIIPITTIGSLRK